MLQRALHLSDVGVRLEALTIYGSEHYGMNEFITDLESVRGKETATS